MEEPAPSEVGERKLWFATLARGGVALLFAMVAIANPHPWMPASRLAKLFAVYAVADSLCTFIGADRARRLHAVRHGRLLAVEGVLSLGTAVVAIAFPTVTALRVIGGLRGLVIGTSDVLWSRRGYAGDLIELAGVVAFAFGLLVLAWPGPGQVALPWLLGLAALVSGGLLVAGSLSHLRPGAIVDEPRPT